MNEGSMRVGVDIGGTFTDIVFLGRDGTLHTRKVSSSVDNYARAIVQGIGEVFAETGLSPADVGEVRHGTTVASNALLELKGAKVGLIGTAGFRDVLEIRTLRMPRLYDLAWEKPPVLVERRLRQVVDERMDNTGAVVRPLDIASAERAVDALLAEGVEAIAVCLLNAFANPAHERAVAEVVRAKAPDLPLCISFDVLPEMKEYERTSTTVVNAYVLPVVSAYLAALRRDLDAAGVAAQVLLMQSNGGLTTSAAAARLPMHIVESGPAGGVVGAQALAEACGIDDVITFDMGGTTAKASMIAGGQVTRAQEMQVGGSILSGSRLLTGSGYALKVPAIDLAEVGAGGGSIVHVDAGGLVKVGPHSAGAVPGPVCYDAGGEAPTVTDCNVVLGYINPEHLVGGELRLNAEKARTAIEERIARPLGLEVEEAALGAHRIAAANMIRAIKAVSTERGRDPANYTLFAFGGNGPLFAAGMARELRIARVVVPPSPGLFSSFGLLYADVEHHYSRTVNRLLTVADPADLEAAWTALEQEATAQLASEGFTGTAAVLERRASLHYKGQTFELTVDAPGGPCDPVLLAVLAEAFGQEHERVYGHRAGPEEPVELVHIHLIGRGIPEASRVPDRLVAKAARRPERGSRAAWFGRDSGWLETPVVRRADLEGGRTGPLIVEEYDATCLVPPGAKANLDRYGNIVIDL